MCHTASHCHGALHLQLSKFQVFHGISVFFWNRVNLVRVISLSINLSDQVPCIDVLWVLHPFNSAGVLRSKNVDSSNTLSRTHFQVPWQYQEAEFPTWDIGWDIFFGKRTIYHRYMDSWIFSTHFLGKHILVGTFFRCIPGNSINLSRLLRCPQPSFDGTDGSDGAVTDGWPEPGVLVAWSNSVSSWSWSWGSLNLKHIVWTLASLNKLLHWDPN